MQNGVCQRKSLAHSAIALGQLVLAHKVAPCQEWVIMRVNEKNKTAVKFRDWLPEEEYLGLTATA
jgi:hypothetical protein